MIIVEKNRWFEAFQRFDLMLLGCVAVIVTISVLFVTSAGHGVPGSGTYGFGVKQAMYVGIGAVAFVCMQQVHYMTMLKFVPLLYAGAIVLLCGLFFARPINGARCWYDLYFFKFEPSEITKPILIMTLAHYMMYRDSYKTLKGLAAPFLLAAVPLVLILKEPDLGGAMSFAPVIFVMLFVAGAQLKHLALTGFVGLCGMVVLWTTVMHVYQKKRVLAWLYPEQYQLGEAWQQLLSQIAIGSGGFWGKGLNVASQNNLHLLPEKHTDFIYAVIAEEGGFIVAATLLIVIFIAALSGLGIAARTREPAGKLIAVGCVTILCSQVLINIAITLRLLPCTGLTLPFVSYGGSSMVSSFLILGLLMNIGSKRDVVLAKDDFK